jgi:hypothetical protein
MSQPAKYDITTYQGDTFTLSFYIDGDQTGKTLEMQVRTSPASGSAFVTVLDAAMTKIYDVTEDKTLVVAAISAATMATFTPSTIYAYDFQSDDSGNIQTWLYGSFSVMAEVTR